LKRATVADFNVANFVVKKIASKKVNQKVSKSEPAAAVYIDFRSNSVYTRADSMPPSLVFLYSLPRLGINM
jgi:hypothetical protein